MEKNPACIPLMSTKFQIVLEFFKFIIIPGMSLNMKLNSYEIRNFVMENSMHNFIVLDYAGHLFLLCVEINVPDCTNMTSRKSKIYYNKIIYY